MECIKWEESGLLFVSGELESSETEDYRNHLSVCRECKAEHETYLREKSSFFTVENLSEVTRPELDSAIVAKCARRGMYATNFVLSAVVKKTVLSVFFLSLGFAGMGYFVYVRNDAQQMQLRAAKSAPTQQAPVVSAIPESESLFAAVDDSLLPKNDSGRIRPFGDKLGNIGSAGVTTVDVKRE